MPDYKKLGADVKSVAHIVHFDDEVSWDPHEEFDIDAFLPPSPTTPTLLSSNSDSGQLRACSHSHLTPL